jgi:pimeloyl-ACP methyl ester carboxylesterase
MGFGRMKILSDGVELCVTDSGAGETALVFQHHWGGSSRTWDDVVLRLKDRFRCVAFDARGAGESQAPAFGYGTADHARDALNVIASLKLARYVLVGHSMGGKAAQWLAARRPAGLVGLVLVASAPLAPMVIDEEQRQQMRKAYRDRNTVEWTLDNVLLGSPVKAASREQLIVDALRLSPAAMAGWLEIGSREDGSMSAASIKVPVLIVAGELDRVDPVPVVMSHLISHYPSAEVHFLPGKGHLLPVEAAEDLACLIDSFTGARSEHARAQA